MVCWFARLLSDLMSAGLCPFPVLSINTWAGHHIRAFAPAASFCGPVSSDTCLASVLVYRVTMTEYPRQDSLNNRHLFSDRPGRQKHTSRFEPIWFLVRTLAWLADNHLLAMSTAMAFPPCNLMTWFNLRYALKGPIFEYSHTRVRAST